jgi:stage V sporulation protein D (sporulation-specific penicillin-binding protein)
MTPSLNNIKKRTVIMAVIVLALLAALVVRIAYWQIIRGDELSKKAKSQQQGSSVITAERGKIYDRNGKVLAESASVNTLTCNPQDIKAGGNAEVIAQKLVPVIDMQYDTILNLLTKNSRYQVIKKRISAEETEQIKAFMDSSNDKEIAKAFTGIYFEDDSKRYYPFNIAPHILGFTGYDNNGLQGIELTFDDNLSGTSGSVASNQTAKGTTLEEQQAEYITHSASGDDVVLTIDETIQHFLEKQLQEAVDEYELKEGAAGIIMNPKTGEILAMATKPDFDSNNPYDIEQFEKYAIMFDDEIETDDDEDEDDDELSSPKPTEDPKVLSDETIASMRNKMWRNKAISDSYEPGSTFKIITAAAALEEHVVDLNSTFYCPGFKVVADRNIGCANESGHGPETFVEGVQNSCNPVFMELGLKLGADKFMEYFTSFGLTEKTGIDLVGEASSIYYEDGMNEVDLATSAFGQGFQVTPIQLVTAVSAAINGGERMRPHIVKEIKNDYGIVKSYEPEVINRVISKETSDTLCEILESVVSEPNATGKNAYVKGCRIGGKTGTSEKGNRNEGKRIASFIGFAPANDPQLVCLIMLDEPQINNKYGGSLAAPLAGSIIEETMDYLGIEKQYTESEIPDVPIENPDVRDMDVDEAKTTLANLNMNVRVVGSGDTVVEQLPKPGIMLNENSMIILYTDDSEISNVTVPNVSGMSVSDARYTLMEYNLNFEIAGAGHSESSVAYAFKQSVEPGEKVSPGTVVGVEFRQTAID